MNEIQRQASEDFSKARTKEFFSRIMHFMDTDKNRLLSLNDVREILKPRGESYKGMSTVPIELIVGSEGRYRDFNKYFLPRREHLRSRWERVDEARLNDITLPPIQLYEIGGVYFVRDGNHRVSVARAQGVEMVDAEVISLSTEIQLSPNMTIDQLRSVLLKYEKIFFYEKTSFKELTGCDTLNFTRPGRYDVIYNHILVHKYYLNQDQTGEVSFSNALVSWYNNVYDPIISIIKEDNLVSLFPQRTPGDLYVWIVKHWDILKKKYGIHYSLYDAVHDFRNRFGKRKAATPFALIKSFLSGIFGTRR
ncbi:hypothetical protein AGMMS50230_09240 [Spirochaetia bacterium]|nr:hypothetical protein AGMMS50230_09240 [Spirochaetia bacterium]